MLFRSLRISAALLVSLAGLASIAVTNTEAVKVAVIGGGIAGTSFAYYLQNPELLNLSKSGASQVEFDVDIYESRSRLGGRLKATNITTGDPEDNDGDGIPNQTVVEVGASLYVDVNINVHSMAQRLNLQINNRPMTDLRLPYNEGMWNGNYTAWTLPEGSSWNPINWTPDSVLATRYGGVSTLTEKFYPAVASFLEQFMQVYSMQGTWTNILDLVNRLGMKALLDKSYYDYLTQNVGVPGLFVDEMVSGITLNNYGLDARSIHAVAGLISSVPIITNMVSINGGNHLLTKAAANAAGAQTFLNAPVRRIDARMVGNCNPNDATTKLAAAASPGANRVGLQSSVPGCRVRYTVATASSSKEYDAVVFAAPFHRLNLTSDSYPFQPSNVPFKRLYVTIAAGHLDPTYYGLPSNVEVPNTILVTNSSSDAVPNQAFNSMGALTYLGPASDGKKVVKYFSNSALSDKTLGELFTDYDNSTKLATQIWDAYPVMSPASFSAMGQGYLEIGFAAWYLNVMEPFISTLETQAITAQNVAALVRNWFADWA